VLHIEPDAYGYTFDHMVETDGVSINPVCARASLADGQETKLPPPKPSSIDELPDYTNISQEVGGDRSAHTAICSTAWMIRVLTRRSTATRKIRVARTCTY
jgi:hypothetical protein